MGHSKLTIPETCFTTVLVLLHYTLLLKPRTPALQTEGRAEAILPMRIAYHTKGTLEGMDAEVIIIIVGIAFVLSRKGRSE